MLLLLPADKPCLSSCGRGDASSAGLLVLGWQPFASNCSCSCRSNESIVVSKVNLQSMRCSGSSAVSMVVNSGSAVGAARAQITPSSCSSSRISVGDMFDDIWGWNCVGDVASFLRLHLGFSCALLLLALSVSLSLLGFSALLLSVVAAACIYTQNPRQALPTPAATPAACVNQQRCCDPKLF